MATKTLTEKSLPRDRMCDTNITLDVSRGSYGERPPRRGASGSLAGEEKRAREVRGHRHRF